MPKKAKHIIIERLVQAPVLTQADIAEITRLVFYAPAPQPADAMLIFGAPEGDWSPAAGAFKQGLVKFIVVSGGTHERTGGKTEASLIKKDLVRLGVPDSIVIEDGSATNSLENVEHFKNILKSNRVSSKSILYLTLRHHAGRGYLT